MYGLLLLAGLFFYFAPFRIGMVCGRSMEPTLKNGQWYVLDRAFYHHFPIAAGDIVVFKRAGDHYVKRVVAGPGEAVWVLRHRDEAPDTLVMDFQLDLLRRTLQRPVFARSGKLIRRRVPPGFCYVVGDEMSLSEDSRSFGPVDLSSIEGRLLFDTPSLSPLDGIAVEAPVRRPGVRAVARPSDKAVAVPATGPNKSVRI
jgi:signal peptidase I